MKHGTPGAKFGHELQNTRDQGDGCQRHMEGKNHAPRFKVIFKARKRQIKSKPKKPPRSKRHKTA
jgi:hypothetical protein